MAASVENRNRHTEPVLAEVDKTLAAIEANYGFESWALKVVGWKDHG